MDNHDTSLIKCPHCGRTVLRSGRNCPYCLEPLAKSKHRNARQKSPRHERQASSGSKASSSKKQKALILIPIFFLIAFVLLAAGYLFASLFTDADMAKPEKLSFSSDLNDAIDEQAEGVPPRPARKPTVHIRNKKEPASGSEGGATPRDSGEDNLAKKQEAARPDTSSEQNEERERRIQAVFTEIFEELKKEEIITTDTIYMKSGREIHCSIIEESDTRVKIRRRGVTITVPKEKIESIKSMTLEDMEQQLRELAMARATEVVDKDLVRDGRKWVPRQETVEYKIESFLAFLQEGGTVANGLLGGKLRLKVKTKERPDGAPDDMSLVAIEAKGTGLDVARLSNLLSLPIKASGRYNLNVTAELDKHDLTTLSGQASVDGTNAGIPPIDAGMIVLPRNVATQFNANLSAKDGEISIKGFALRGKAYDLSGNGIIRLSNPLASSTVNCSFYIILKEPPTLKDPELIRLGGKGFLNALVKARTKLAFELVGTLRSAEIKLAPGSNQFPLVKQLNR